MFNDQKKKRKENISLYLGDDSCLHKSSRNDYWISFFLKKKALPSIWMCKNKKISHWPADIWMCTRLLVLKPSGGGPAYPSTRPKWDSGGVGGPRIWYTVFGSGTFGAEKQLENLHRLWHLRTQIGQDGTRRGGGDRTSPPLIGVIKLKKKPDVYMPMPKDVPS